LRAVGLREWSLTHTRSRLPRLTPAPSHARGTLSTAPQLSCAAEPRVSWRPPLDVLRMATQEATAAVGADSQLGTLPSGKLADRVLLDVEPPNNIADLSEFATLSARPQPLSLILRKGMLPRNQRKEAES
jgi:cytosine/adenosine deaminase-related metal-dependent hydrolase